jgi:hypothetical protein
VPDLLLGEDNSFWWSVTHRSGFGFKDMNSFSLSTTTPLVISRVTIRLTSPQRIIRAYETKNTSKNSKLRNTQNLVIICRWMIKHTKLWFQKPKTVIIRWQITLQKTPSLYWWWLVILYPKGGILGLGALEGAPTTWAEGPPRYKAELAQNRCTTPFYGHTACHASSGARTRTKTMASSSPFQRILICLIPMSCDGDITKTVSRCRC